MGITHVVRGDDHLSNTPKQILILKALGWEPPRYGHLPLICGPDKAPLSKRHGATAFVAYRENGYLPEALANFLALLGWAYDDSTELFSLDELVEKFSIERVNRAPAVFDTEKLLWMNGHYIRNLPEDIVFERVRNWLDKGGYDVESRDPEWLRGIIRLAIPRSRTLQDFPAQLHFFLSDDFEYAEKAVKKHLQKAGAREILQKVRDVIAQADALTEEALETPLRALMESEGVGFGKIAQPLRVALTGSDASPGIFDVLHYLGKERTLARLDYALENLCG
jgi:glutamyl-tRNA synthetase